MITTLTFSSGVVFSALKINGPGGKIALPAAFLAQELAQLLHVGLVEFLAQRPSSSPRA